MRIKFLKCVHPGIVNTGFIDKLKYRILPTQTMYGDAFIELINLKTFSLYDDDGNIDDMFLGESSIGKTVPSKKKSNSAADDVKVKHLIEKVNKNSLKLIIFFKVKKYILKEKKVIIH